MNRRDFLKLGSVGIAAALIPVEIKFISGDEVINSLAKASQSINKLSYEVSKFSNIANSSVLILDGFRLQLTTMDKNLSSFLQMN